ncbi:ribonuclease H-like domain-containing protein [Bacillus massiliglaciei]|uniref:ribonuclease H-like domain-containing protein n=1 Tax=Bacillus massiliglaciei TaxID=1816693 RepID=UPI000ABB04FE|nr:ribonuclease H-like domain-containing protein [Bacillus massiliglaciei]
MSLKNKLSRLKTHMNLEAMPAAPAPAEVFAGVEVPFKDKWLTNHTRVYSLDGSYCFIREVRYPLQHRHGHYSFSDLEKIISAWNTSSLEHPLSSKGNKIDELFFFDTETTGLGGGTGNQIFILGYAFFDKDSIVVRQHILPEPGNEIPLYHSFLEQVNYETLVTYNGKAFDWPQLKTRHTLIKEHVPKLPDFGHFDLYHASRRLWKNKLERVKLSAVEKEIMGVVREDDIPGYLAPMIYFDFVERKDPEILFGILKHNEWDVLSLITLYIHLSRQILQMDGYNEESIEIANWLSYLGRKAEAGQSYEEIIKKGNISDRMAASHALAFQKKREGRYESAYELWSLVAADGNDMQRMEAVIECAKLLEHQFKKNQECLVFVSAAYQASAQYKEGKKLQKYREDLLKRQERLKKKCLKWT